MTEITRSIEISSAKDKVWSHIHPSKWTKIFNFVKEVNGYTNGEAGVGTKARVVAGKDETTAVKYNVEITEFVPNVKIVYRRYNGPLKGKGEIHIKALQSGTLLKRTSYYDDNLSESTIKTLSEGMENDNLRIKTIIE